MKAPAQRRCSGEDAGALSCAERLSENPSDSPGAAHPQDLGRWAALRLGGVAQLGERLLCKQEVIGSIPFTSTSITGFHT